MAITSEYIPSCYQSSFERTLSVIIGPAEFIPESSVLWSYTWASQGVSLVCSFFSWMNWPNTLISPVFTNGDLVSPDGFKAYFDRKRLRFECFCGLKESRPQYVNVRKRKSQYLMDCNKCGLHGMVHDHHISGVSPSRCSMFKYNLWYGQFFLVLPFRAQRWR